MFAHAIRVLIEHLYSFACQAVYVPRTDIHDHTARLISSGFTKVYALKGGWKKWFRSGYPVEAK